MSWGFQGAMVVKINLIASGIGALVAACASQAFADTPASSPKSTAITINGVTFNLPAGSTVSVSDTGAVSITLGKAAPSPPAADQAASKTKETGAPVAPTTTAPPAAAVASAPAASSPQPAAPAQAGAAAVANADPAAQAPSSGAIQLTMNPASAQSNNLAPNSSSTFNIKFGLGLTFAQTFGTERADSVSLANRADGSVYAQVKTLQNTNILALAETHYYIDAHSGTFAYSPSSLSMVDPEFHNSGTANGGMPTYSGWDVLEHDAGALVACGPWGFIDSTYKAGCGPVFLAAIGADGKSATQFGVGWAMGLAQGPDANSQSLNIAIGALFDPSDQTVDYHVVNPTTKLVYPQYQAGVLAGTTPVLVHRPTTALFLMISKTIN